MNATGEVRRTFLRLFNVSEAARQLGISVQQMHHWIYAGILPKPHVTLGRRHFYTQDELDALTRKARRNEKPPVICDARRNKRMDAGSRKYSEQPHVPVLVNATTP